MSLSVYRRTPRETSPLNLMQERHRDDAWGLLVGTILFNMVHGSKAAPVHEEFLRRWPTPNALGLYAVKTPSGVVVGDWSHAAGKKHMGEVVELFRPLGFQTRRADRIYDMTADFLELRPDLHEDIQPTRLKGIGKYGSDSFTIFFRGYLVEDVDDKELRAYVTWALSRGPGGLVQEDHGGSAASGGRDAQAQQPGPGGGGG